MCKAGHRIIPGLFVCLAPDNSSLTNYKSTDILKKGGKKEKKS